MTIYITTKTIGKRKGYMEQVPYELKASVSTVEELIKAIVSNEVTQFNKRKEKSFIGFLSEETLSEQVEHGKVGYGTIHNTKPAQVEEAQEVAIQAFADGLVKLFINDDEVEGLKQPLSIKEGDQLTFIRLTFLAGRLW